MDYLERTLYVLLTIGSIEIEELDFSGNEDEESATMEALIRLPDGSRLYVNLTVTETEGFPAWKRYAFQFMTAENATVFRYDNSEYHPGLPHAPHHKHEGADERVVGCPQPSISLIRDEIAAYLKDLN